MPYNFFEGFVKSKDCDKKPQLQKIPELKKEIPLLLKLSQQIMKNLRKFDQKGYGMSAQLG